MVFHGKDKKGKFISKRQCKAMGKRSLFGQLKTEKTEECESAGVDELDLHVSDETNAGGSYASSTSSNEHDQAISWRDGRRIVDLGHFVQQLKCKDCSQMLDLTKIETERRRGFGSTLYVTCSCGIVNSVTTNKTHKVHTRGAPIFDINTKAAVGLIHSGSGHRQIQNFMSAMEIPTISFNSMKDREHEIGNHVTKVAQQSCTEALQLEKNFIEKNQSPSYSETCRRQLIR